MTLNRKVVQIRRTDGNQKQIVADLRDLGYSARSTHVIGQGFPDIVVGKHGINMLVEIKERGKDLTPDERTFIDDWRGTVIVGYDALQIHEKFEQLRNFGRL